jgi:hypothetical protein
MTSVTHLYACMHHHVQTDPALTKDSPPPPHDSHLGMHDAESSGLKASFADRENGELNVNSTSRIRNYVRVS